MRAKHYKFQILILQPVSKEIEAGIDFEFMYQYTSEVSFFFNPDGWVFDYFFYFSV